MATWPTRIYINCSIKIADVFPYTVIHSAKERIYYSFSKKKKTFSFCHFRKFWRNNLFFYNKSYRVKQNYLSGSYPPWTNLTQNPTLKQLERRLIKPRSLKDNYVLPCSIFCCQTLCVFALKCVYNVRAPMQMVAKF